MAPANIPGFYYDEAKKKYFKIQPNHIAPTGSSYSKDSVKKEAETILARKRQRMLGDLERREKLQRSRILVHPLVGRTGLKRESGVRDDISRTTNEAWSHGLGKRTILQCRNERDIEQFVCDEATGSFIYAQNEAPHYSTIRAIPFDRGLECNYTLTVGAGMESEISSMELSPSRALMTTAMGGSQRACVHLTRLVDPAQPQISPDSNVMDPLDALINESVLTSDVSIKFRALSAQTFWASSARPDEARSDFALATSEGTILVAENQTTWNCSRSQSFENRHSRKAVVTNEILAVHWLDVNVVLNGTREGTVFLWDVRTRGLEGTSLRLQHPSAINHIRKVNENVIIVAGIKDQLCTYDLRFLPKYPDTGPTRPYVTFPAYENKALNGLALGFDMYGGVVAAASDKRRVELFDVKSGRELQAGPGGAMGNRNLRGLARCVKFVTGDDSRYGMRLMVANGAAIYEWAWNDGIPK